MGHNADRIELPLGNSLSPLEMSQLSFCEISCPVCGSDRADPIAIGEDFDSSDRNPQSFLVARCRECQLVYLNPRPVPRDRDLHGLTPGEMLERSPDPKRVLAAVRDESGPRGEVLFLVGNVESLTFKLFGGRHWSHYGFPHRLQFFRSGLLKEIAEDAGFRVVSSRTFPDGTVWIRSLRNLLADWGASERWIERFDRSRGVTLPIFNLIDGVCRLLGRGAVLGVTLQPRHAPASAEREVEA